MMKEVPCLDCRGQGYIPKFSDNSVWSERCSNCCGTGVVKVFVTNADRLDAMSLEEKAVFIKALMFNDFKPACKKSTFFSAERKPECEEDCVSCILEWLQQPCEEGT